jgi:hypothetical protein
VKRKEKKRREKKRKEKHPISNQEKNETLTLTRREKGRDEQGRGGAYLGSLLAIIIADGWVDHHATVQEDNRSRRGGEVSPPRSLHLGLGPKGTTVMPLDGATCGYGHMCAPARGTVEAPPPSPRRELRSPSFLCFAGNSGHEKRGEDKEKR